jgi:hypothetical protein
MQIRVLTKSNHSGRKQFKDAKKIPLDLVKMSVLIKTKMKKPPDIHERCKNLTKIKNEEKNLVQGKDLNVLKIILRNVFDMGKEQQNPRYNINKAENVLLITERKEKIIAVRLSPLICSGSKSLAQLVESEVNTMMKKKWKKKGSLKKINDEWNVILVKNMEKHKKTLIKSMIDMKENEHDPR